MRGARLCLVVAAASAAAACAQADDGPVTAAAALTLSREAIPFSGPLAITYTFTMAPDVPAVAGDYQVQVRFRDLGGELLWSDDHEPPVPVAEWEPGSTVAYTREQFLPRVPHIGLVDVDVALESPASGVRLRLDAPMPVDRRVYRLATFDVRPQTTPLEFGNGWYALEEGEGSETWRWSADEASVGFVAPASDATLYLDVDQPVGSLTGPRLLEVWLGEELIGTFSVPGPRTTLRATITADVLVNAQEDEFRFRVEPAFVPSTLDGLPDSTDDRLLGLRVFNAILLPS